MNRPSGITASAAVSLVGSVGFLLFAVLMLAVSFAPPPDAPPGFTGMMIAAAIFLVALAGLGIWTSIGLLRLRAWARTSILVFGGIMAAFSLLMMVMTTIIPLPEPKTSQVVSIGAVRQFMILVYSVPFLIGIWWVTYFNRESTKEAFAVGLSGGQGRPLSVSIIGWWFLLGGLVGLVPMAARFPLFLAGVILTGWKAVVAYLILSAVSVYLGWGLLKLKERARVLTIVWFGVMAAHTAWMYLMPGAFERMQEYQRSLPAPFAGPEQPPDVETMSYITTPIIVLLLGAGAWFLVRNREAFRAKAAAPQTQTPLPPPPSEPPSSTAPPAA